MAEDSQNPETRSLSDMMLDDQQRISDATLVQLATADTSASLVDDLLSRDIPTQLRAFMLAKAKADLIRVIKLSGALSQMEDKFVERAINDMDETSLKNLQHMIETTSDALDRTENFISKVIGDQSIQLTIDQSTNIYNDNSNNSTNSFVSVLSDQTSRKKLQDLAARLLSPISVNQAELVNSQVMDSDELEPSEIVVDEEDIEGTTDD